MYMYTVKYTVVRLGNFRYQKSFPITERDSDKTDQGS